MIRRDAHDDLLDVSSPKARSSVVRIVSSRRAKKRIVRAARSLTPEQGRAGLRCLTDSIGVTPSYSTGQSKLMTEGKIVY
jgi:hypothetical protein